MNRIKALRSQAYSQLEQLECVWEENFGDLDIDEAAKEGNRLAEVMLAVADAIHNEAPHDWLNEAKLKGALVMATLDICDLL